MSRRSPCTLDTPELPLELPEANEVLPRPRGLSLSDELVGLREFGQQTRRLVTRGSTFAGQSIEIPTFVNEFWTSRQRQANALHEISYRACFKPQLPRFFIERLTRPGDRVYDPFMGRGTTLLEAALLGRIPLGCDINPLSLTLVRPRLNPPELHEIQKRLAQIQFGVHQELPEELLVFFHPATLKQICSLRKYLHHRRTDQTLDAVDDWIALVALNRLTGHSKGFFSVYTLPPNQAVSIQSQRKINERRNQTPPQRDVIEIIMKKSRILLADCTVRIRKTLRTVGGEALLLTSAADQTPGIASGTIDLVVTSPPFLDVVQYDTDNWLRCWFLGFDAKAVKITILKKVEAWQGAMTAVFRELYRMLKPGGHVAFELGEVRGGTLKLEEVVIPCAIEAGLQPLLVLINDQQFTKTANCWGIDNMSRGTNTNRIVILQKTDGVSPKYSPCSPQ
jgi:hypothetical protein